MSGFTNDEDSYGFDNGAVVDIVNNSGVQGALTIGTTATEAKVSANRLQYRKSLTVYNNSTSTLYWGYTNAVTTTTGTPLPPFSLTTFGVGDGLGIWLIGATAGNNVRITESA